MNKLSGRIVTVTRGKKYRADVCELSNPSDPFSRIDVLESKEFRSMENAEAWLERKGVK